MILSLLNIQFVVSVTVINFLYFYYVGLQRHADRIFECDTNKLRSFQYAKFSTIENCVNKTRIRSACNGLDATAYRMTEMPQMSPILTKLFVEYKSHSLAKMRYPEWTVLIHNDNVDKCKWIANLHVSRKVTCAAVVFTDSEATHNLLRFESNITYGDPNYDINRLYPSGVFNNVANEISRIKQADKMKQLIASLDDLEQFTNGIIRSRGFIDGDDIVVMVVNAGEIDLFANFACSCYLHNISMNNMLVFAGSPDVIPIIESLGAMGIYHESSFAYVSKTASNEYLDKIFVDMMWYKSFAVWLVLKLKFNILFQDVDLVWFKDPLQYFHSYLLSIPAQQQPQQQLSIESEESSEDLPINSIKFHEKIPQNFNPDAFLSDDGQRGVRYTPFYANSGFYYLKSNPKTIYFTWTIMTAFDLLHVTGSHQNIFTIRLMEGMDLSKFQGKLLTLKEFPSGLKYHHDKPFMIGIRDGHETPYVFHMCWTKNKLDKLKYFRLTSMWYLTETASMDLASIAGLKIKTESSDGNSQKKEKEEKEEKLKEEEEDDKEGEGEGEGEGEKNQQRKLINNNKESKILTLSQEYSANNLSYERRWHLMSNIICHRSYLFKMQYS